MQARETGDSQRTIARFTGLRYYWQRSQGYACGFTLGFILTPAPQVKSFKTMNKVSIEA